MLYQFTFLSNQHLATTGYKFPTCSNNAISSWYSRFQFHLAIAFVKQKTSSHYFNTLCENNPFLQYTLQLKPLNNIHGKRLPMNSRQYSVIYQRRGCSDRFGEIWRFILHGGMGGFVEKYADMWRNAAHFVHGHPKIREPRQKLTGPTSHSGLGIFVSCKYQEILPKT